jgi:hypothetical protein
MRIIKPAALAIALVFVSLSAKASFVPILSGQAIYDTQQDITWTVDANINDEEFWNTQLGWAAGLTIDGVGGWRLPNIDINNDDAIINCSSGTQAACMDNEFGHLFYYGAGTTLGSGVTFVSPGPFSNIQNGAYWTSTQFALLEDRAWVFRMGLGSQGVDDTTTDLRFAWAVHDGNAAVPVPAAVWLFGSALGILGWVRRRKTR